MENGQGTGELRNRLKVRKNSYPMVGIVADDDKKSLIRLGHKIKDRARIQKIF